MSRIFLTLPLLLICISNVFGAPSESTLSIHGRVFSYYSSHDLNSYWASIEHAIITLHGSERNADTYYNTIDELTNVLHNKFKALILSPHFKEVKDKTLEGELIWDSEGWLKGDLSLSNKRISSFGVMDHFLGLLGDSKHFPNLKSIVLVGHSAGGQFIQRFAMGSRKDEKFPLINFRYVVANPGTYAYLTRERPTQGVSNSFQVPFDISCSTYNDYKFGLDSLNEYMGQSTKEELISRFVKREVIYLLGENDNVATEVDQDCEAALQGSTRLERARNFKALLDQKFPENRHALKIVSGIGHTQWGLYTSPAGRELLFY